MFLLELEEFKVSFNQFFKKRNQKFGKIRGKTSIVLSSIGKYLR